MPNRHDNVHGVVIVAGRSLATNDPGNKKTWMMGGEG